MKKILFVPREMAWLVANQDDNIGKIGTLQTRMEAQVLLTLDFTGKFDIDDGGKLYVFPGHGTAGSGTSHWANAANSLTAEEVAELTAERFPDCTGVSIRIYACHSSEGGYNSFASRFARAFRPYEGTYDVTICGYRGAITPSPMILHKDRNLSNQEPYLKHFPSGSAPVPRESVKHEAKHRWSKVSPPTPVYNAKGAEVKIQVFASRASEARDEVAWLTAVKGTVSSQTFQNGAVQLKELKWPPDREPAPGSTLLNSGK